MTKRFFKATIGDRVYFRASTRVYASAQLAKYGLTFSGKSAAPGWSPCTEIDKAEHARLVALKATRIMRSGGHERAFSNAPDNSWVAVEVADGVVS